MANNLMPYAIYNILYLYLCLMHIPPSNDTLFMRGFSYRQDIEHIREFFARECGRNTVEFFKEDGKDQLYVALRFESKSIAKEVMERFNDTDVLGDRINMSWYKDLRRLRTTYGNSSDSYNRRPMYRPGGGGGGGGGYGMDDQYSDYRGGYGGRPAYAKPRYTQVASRPRRYTRSSSHSRSRSVSRTPSGSRSRSRSSSRSYESRDHKKKRRSPSDSGRRRKSGKRKSSKVSATSDHDSSQSDDSLPPVKPVKTKKSTETAENISPVRKITKLAAKTKEKVAETESTSVDPDHLTDAVEPVEASPATQPAAQTKAGARAGVRSTIKKATAKPAAEAQLNDSTDAAVADTPSSAPKKADALKESMKSKKGKEEKKVVEETASEIEDDNGESAVDKSIANARKTKEAEESRVVRQSKVARDMAPPPNDLNSSTEQGYDVEELRPLKKRKQMPPSSVGDEFDRPFDEFDYEEDGEFADGKRQRFTNPMLDARPPRAGGYDDMRLPPSGRRRANYDTGAPFGGRDVGRGAMGLSQEKMIMIKEKKEEIEKAYRQDCETFATVTKLLINKDPDLEDRIQNSLRENLKEIGQRCIQELRDFVDRLKSEDDI